MLEGKRGIWFYLFQKTPACVGFVEKVLQFRYNLVRLTRNPAARPGDGILFWAGFCVPFLNLFLSGHVLSQPLCPGVFCYHRIVNCSFFFFFYKKINVFFIITVLTCTHCYIYSFVVNLFLAVLGFCRCAQAFSSCGQRRLLSSCRTEALGRLGFST